MTITKLIRQPDDYNVKGDNTPLTVPDPDLSDFRVFGDNILLRPFEPPSEYEFKNGLKLALPPSLEADRAYLQNVGRVLKIGELAFRDPNFKPDDKGYPWGYYGAPWVKENDWVLFARNSGQKIMVKGVKMLLIKDTFLLGKINDPKDVDVNFGAITFDKYK